MISFFYIQDLLITELLDTTMQVQVLLQYNTGTQWKQEKRRSDKMELLPVVVLEGGVFYFFSYNTSSAVKDLTPMHPCMVSEQLHLRYRY